MRRTGERLAGQGARPAALAVVALLLLATVAPLWARSPDRAISRHGRRLAAVLSAMDVENRWLPGHPVDWQTGVYDPTAMALRSHCSAFVAAACARFDIYILRPPDHPELLLSNAQCRWLASAGDEHGWEPVADGTRAQRLANRGHLVVACYQSPDEGVSGHIAVIRPGTKSRALIEAEGPDVIQAGGVNYEETTVAHAFRFHPGAFDEGRIRYYAHPTR